MSEPSGNDHELFPHAQMISLTDKQKDFLAHTIFRLFPPNVDTRDVVMTIVVALCAVAHHHGDIPPAKLNELIAIAYADDFVKAMLPSRDEVRAELAKEAAELEKSS